MPLCWGEALDRIAILEVRCARLRGLPEGEVAAREIARLRAACGSAVLRVPGIESQLEDLTALHRLVWRLEDRLEALDAACGPAAEFFDLSRAVRALNKRRAAIKAQITERLGGEFAEPKVYGARSTGPDRARSISPGP